MKRQEWIDAFGLFMEALPDALLLHEEDSVILAANPSAVELLGIPRQRLLGRTLMELSPDPEAVIEHWKRSRTARPTLPGAISVSIDESHPAIELRIDSGLVIPSRRSGDGRLVMSRLRRREVGSEPFRLLQEQIDRLNQEVRQRRRVEGELERRLEAEREARRAAAEANRLKDELLSSLSHELRTPLNILLGWIDILEDMGPESPLLEKALPPMKKALATETELVEDLLDVQRITTAEMRLEFERMRLGALVQDVARTVETGVLAKGLDLVLRVDGDLPAIYMDRRRIRQVVHNLLSNAFRFTSEDDVVQVTVTGDGKPGHQTVEVRDTGRGIPRDLLPHVFDPFRQGEGHPRDAPAGVGLGLAIVKRIVELHGGDVTLESDGEGTGTTATVHLPVAATPPGAEGGTAASDVNSDSGEENGSPSDPQAVNGES